MTDQYIRKGGTGGDRTQFGEHNRTDGGDVITRPEFVDIEVSTPARIAVSYDPLPELPEELGEPNIWYSYGDDNPFLYVGLNFGEGSDAVTVSVWVDEFGDQCDSINAGDEETPWESDIDDAVLEHAHALRERIALSLDSVQASAGDYASQAIIDAAHGIAPAPSTAVSLDFADGGVSIDALSDAQTYQLLNAIIARQGLISPVIDVDEAHYRITEDIEWDATNTEDTPEAHLKRVEAGLVRDKVNLLATKLGGDSRTVAKAITDTAAWDELEEVMTNALSDPWRGTASAVRRALDELLAE